MANCLRCTHGQIMFFQNNRTIEGYAPSEYCFCDGHFQTPILYEEMTSFVCPSENFPQDIGPLPEPIAAPIREDTRGLWELPQEEQEAVEILNPVQEQRQRLRDGFRNPIPDYATVRHAPDINPNPPDWTPARNTVTDTEEETTW